MVPFKFILAATDFSDPAQHAVHRAALLAQRHGARLGLVHVVNPAPFGRVREWLGPSAALALRVEERRARLRALAAQLAAVHGVAAQLELRIGNSFEELHRAAARADLLVLGQRRRHPLAERVLGGCALRLADTCRQPLLVVRQAASGAYRRILVPTDFTPASDVAAVVAAALEPEIDLQIFHACDASGDLLMREADVSESVIRDCRARQEEGLVARMRRSVARLGLDSRRMSFALGRGSPVAATLRQAQAAGAELIVTAKARRSLAGITVPGSVNRLLRRARCDMLIVPGRLRDPRQAPAPASASAAAPRAANMQGVRCAAAGTALRGPSWTGPQPPAALFQAARHGAAARPAGE